MIKTLFIAAALLFSVAFAQGQSANTFTIKEHTYSLCSAVSANTTAVSGTCTSYSLEGLSAYIKAYMAPNSTTSYQYFLYSDSSCSTLISALTGQCDTCTTDRLVVSCPTSYAPTSTAPAWPTPANGFIQLTACMDSAACVGTSCTVQAVKSNLCIAHKDKSVPTVKATVVSCSPTSGVSIGQFSDVACSSDSVIATVKESVLSCSSREGYYRQYECASANAGTVSISSPKGFVTAEYNTTASSTCSGAPLLEVTFTNGLCTTSSKDQFQTISCAGNTATLTKYSDSACSVSVGSTTVPLPTGCNKGQVVTCSSAAHSVIASAAMMWIITLMTTSLVLMLH